ncbi:hypothetical protein BBR47_25640 [Brevibacillus brevis NBRC 100599]|uniref:Uncharacterized protein n=1 Tax=Brevibacillus brevis (strain 47 / JCM 6285 / NBRC 100599) TaxID=358681 RepID=C0ZCN2_BREBN|nr:hypothetical protein BBR47_25640 [Brevibacillus brevis NBRC 100599]
MKDNKNQLSCGAMFTAPWEFFVERKSDYCEKKLPHFFSNQKKRGETGERSKSSVDLPLHSRHLSLAGHERLDFCKAGTTNRASHPRTDAPVHFHITEKETKKASGKKASTRSSSHA